MSQARTPAQQRRGPPQPVARRARGASHGIGVLTLAQLIVALLIAGCAEAGVGAATAKYAAALADVVRFWWAGVTHVPYIDDGTTYAEWRSKYPLCGHANQRFFDDPTGAAWTAIKSRNCTAPHLFADRDRVVIYREHELSSAGVEDQLQRALAP